MTVRPPKGSFWLFAYGSLMWNPDIPFQAARQARLFGYHRALCIQSWTYRGTKRKPGVVFGLDAGGSVNGIAYRIVSADAPGVFDKVMAREMVSNVYRPLWANCLLEDGKRVQTLAFVADRGNAQYAGRPDEAALVKLIRQGHGKGGACVDYILNTHSHLAELGIRDRALERVVGLLSGQ